jgi:hypothetical protein
MHLDREEVPRPLRFLNFGDALHDELIRGWMPHGGEPLLMGVTLFDDHALWDHGAPGLYALRVSILDPVAALLGCGVEERTLEAVAGAATQAPAERLPQLIRPFTRLMHCAIEADVRWIRAELPAILKLEVRRRAHQQWVQVEDNEVRALLNPMAHGRMGVPHASELWASEDERVDAATELDRLRITDMAAAKPVWSHRFPDFERALHTRLHVVREEGRDAVALAEEELRSAEETLRVAVERGNRAQITRAETAGNVAADTVQMAKVLWKHRDRWLRDCESAVQAVVPHEYLTAVLRVRRAQ